ncbi:MAG: TIGR00730 family Rossman fold protein [Pyrinomonadaceae bacterium]
MKRICVFCGSNAGVRPDYAAAAREMGSALVQRNIGLVFGGGRVGLMGIIADQVIADGGEAIGVIPADLDKKEIAHSGLTELHVVRSMHERKALMAKLSDGFIALPGGFGTYEEFCEVLTWSQLGFQQKPCALYNVAGFYDPLLALFDHAVAEGFVRPEHRELVLVGNSPGDLIEQLANYTPPTKIKWMDLEKS